MATINAQHPDAQTQGCRRVLWETMGNDDQGTAQLLGRHADGSVQVIGTFGGATVTLQGSNDGTNWVTLTDDQGVAITFTTAGLKMFLPRTWKIRAITAGGSGTDLDVHLLLGD